MLSTIRTTPAAKKATFDEYRSALTLMLGLDNSGGSSSGGSSDSSLSAAGACRLRHELENHFTAHLRARADADRFRRERDGARAALLAAEGLVIHYHDQRDAARSECDVLRAQRDAARTAQAGAEEALHHNRELADAWEEGKYSTLLSPIFVCTQRVFSSLAFFVSPVLG